MAGDGAIGRNRSPGEHGDDAQIELHPGDVISLPGRMFRGFTDIAEDIGCLWAVLGNDDPGRDRMFQQAMKQLCLPCSPLYKARTVRLPADRTRLR